MDGELTVEREPGLRLAPTLTFNEWLAHWYSATAGLSVGTWQIADLLNHPQAETPQGQAAIDEVQDRFGLSDQTLSNIKSVGARWPIDKRNLRLSWSHHAAIAYQPNKEELLARADAENLKVHDLREEVAPPKPKQTGPYDTLLDLLGELTGALKAPAPLTEILTIRAVVVAKLDETFGA